LILPELQLFLGVFGGASERSENPLQISGYQIPDLILVSGYQPLSPPLGGGRGLDQYQ